MLIENGSVSTTSASGVSITVPERTLLAVTTSAIKPGEPYKESAFFPYPNGQWGKKTNGKPWYFGKWEDHEAASHRYLDEVDDVQPRCDPG